MKRRTAQKQSRDRKPISVEGLPGLWLPTSYRNNGDVELHGKIYRPYDERAKKHAKTAR
jgi:hypothetical protein